MKIKAVLFATGMIEIWITLCIDSVSILINPIPAGVLENQDTLGGGPI